MGESDCNSSRPAGNLFPKDLAQLINEDFSSVSTEEIRGTAMIVDRYVDLNIMSWTVNFCVSIFSI